MRGQDAAKSPAEICSTSWMGQLYREQTASHPALGVMSWPCGPSDDCGCCGAAPIASSNFCRQQTATSNQIRCKQVQGNSCQSSLIRPP